MSKKEKKKEFDFWPYLGLIVFFYNEIAHIVELIKFMEYLSHINQNSFKPELYNLFSLAFSFSIALSSTYSCIDQILFVYFLRTSLNWYSDTIMH